jgi:3-phenylpropionate/trans-cinnamate dioxygenase ferredoxin subunit
MMRSIDLAVSNDKRGSATSVSDTVTPVQSWCARLCPLAELPGVGKTIAREVAGRRIAVFNVAGTLYALDDLCTHAHSSLSEEGTLCGLIVECALHRAQFNLETGRPVRGPTRKPLRTYELRIDGEEVTAVEMRKRELRSGESA